MWVIFNGMLLHSGSGVGFRGPFSDKVSGGYNIFYCKVNGLDEDGDSKYKNLSCEWFEYESEAVEKIENLKNLLTKGEINETK
jgi:hypothetical protein